MTFNKLLSAFIGLCAFASPAAADSSIPEVPSGYNRNTIFDKVPFYDGYLTDAIIDADVRDGIVRFNNYHYSRRLDLPEITALGEDMKLEVIIGALCDNFDRMGRIFLAFPETGSPSYFPEQTQRIEIARFITPFMNKNKEPDEVPFVYDMEDIRQLLTDSDLISERDVWLEVELFGIPYSANKQIAGCANRNDVFSATVSFAARPTSSLLEGQRGDNDGSKTSLNSAKNSVNGKGNVILTPITISKCELFGNVNLNRYNPAATDTVGETTKTYIFNVPEDLNDSQITLIITNHGADEDGEEYYRRQHIVYLDGEPVSIFTPGGISCEPFRQFNTQRNGIYEAALEDPTWWTEHNNWCPGQAVPTRRITTGPLKKGEHRLMIRVPDAEFYLDDGDFRPSAFMLGTTDGFIVSPSGVESVQSSNGPKLKIQGETLFLDSEEPVLELRVYSMDGQLIEGHYAPGQSFSLAGLPSGQFIIVASLRDGRLSHLKYIK